MPEPSDDSSIPATETTIIPWALSRQMLLKPGKQNGPPLSGDSPFRLLFVETVKILPSSVRVNYSIRGQLQPLPKD